MHQVTVQFSFWQLTWQLTVNYIFRMIFFAILFHTRKSLTQISPFKVNRKTKQTPQITFCIIKERHRNNRTSFAWTIWCDPSPTVNVHNQHCLLKIPNTASLVTFFPLKNSILHLVLNKECLMFCERVFVNTQIQQTQRCVPLSCPTSHVWVWYPSTVHKDAVPHPSVGTPCWSW